MNALQDVDWPALGPPLIAALAAVAVLLADLFLPPARKGLLGGLAVAGLVLAGLSLLPLRGADRATFCLAADPGLCSYRADEFALTVQLIVLGGALLAALLSLPETGPASRHPAAPHPASGKAAAGNGAAGKETPGTGAPKRDASGTGASGGAGEGSLPGGEFWFLLLCSACGATLLPAARDLATLVVALEITTLPAYALVGLRRRGPGPEAALKFFLTSVTATAVGLLGISFVYAGAGSLHLSEIAERLPDADPRLATLAEAGVVLTLAGFAFKTAAVPFHFWVPETYVGAPLPVAGYLSVVGKTAGLAGLVLVTTGAFPGYGGLWGPVLAVLAACTMTAGNAAALRTPAAAPDGVVRLLAWSSIGQAGYLLVPVAAAAYTAPGDALGALLGYALMYAVTNLGAFAVAAHLARRHGARRLADYAGLYARQPGTALALAFFLLCLAGLPPGLAGLFAKVAVLRSAVDAGLGPLAVVTALNVALALAYYLRWTALLFRPAPAGSPAPPRPVPPLAAATALCALAGAAFSVAPQLILGLAPGVLR
ncbi:NADH-quinone oxidoreductase subunit N [Streptomyces hoynatensis]|uniref:NADH-quinone oxidoreductase subunit N n=1 Tax=Streptomyces hoynatensis TaxID=1141874 RepID=A0A3A9YTY9_9ACTN|nr:NADH-quinone oxidoreductase subunit N [Streptomyces hoynatensis]RKN39239.1 NADH-quinone oxidoreductase subunit N [Streptomyces hoynatensis]